MTDGEIIVNAIIRSAAINEIERVEDSLIIVWEANAYEQIEAALQEAGYKLVKL